MEWNRIEIDRDPNHISDLFFADELLGAMALDMASIFSKITMTREQALFWSSKLVDFGTPFAEAHNMITKKVANC